MAITEYTKQNIVPYITGNDYPPTRSARQLIELFNRFGLRDVYKNGLPLHPVKNQSMSRKEYVEDRLDKVRDQDIISLLTIILNEAEQKHPITEELQHLLHEDGYSISSNGDGFVIYGGVVDKSPSVKNDALFQDIENRIVQVLNQAKVSITLMVAWFTNENLRDKLLEKQTQGLDVEIAIFGDGINRKHGVDLTPFKVYQIRGSRGGVMHHKFCVIDNQIIITGSYNWTNNAEFRNDENISVAKDPEQATRFTLEFRRLTR